MKDQQIKDEQIKDDNRLQHQNQLTDECDESQTEDQQTSVLKRILI